MEHSQTQEKAVKYNTSGIVMTIIGAVFLIASIIDVFLGVVSLGGIVTGIILVVGGIYFLFHKKKYHWILYIITFITMGIINFIR